MSMLGSHVMMAAMAATLVIQVGGCTSDGTSAMSDGDAAGGIVGSSPDAAANDVALGPDGSSRSDVEACGLAPTDAGSCNLVAQRSPHITAECSSDPLPTAQGGTIEDGTYVLDAMTYYAGLCPPTADVEGITWVICGQQWELVEDLTADDGGTNVARLNLTRVSQDQMVSSNVMCGPNITRPTMADTQAYTASPGHFVVQVRNPTGIRVDSFTKL